MLNFLSTLSLRRATLLLPVPQAWQPIFYPRSPCGERPAHCFQGREASGFSIHALLAESDHAAELCCGSRHLFYPRSPCGERRNGGVIVRGTHFSIHALLAESDYQYGNCGTCNCYFLSTLSLRRATTPPVGFSALGQDFLSTLSLRRATALGLLGWLRVLFSIHALLAESDLGNVVVGLRTWNFLSTLSLRRATIYRFSISSSSELFYPRSPCGERQQH